MAECLRGGSGDGGGARELRGHDAACIALLTVFTQAELAVMVMAMAGRMRVRGVDAGGLHYGQLAAQWCCTRAARS